MAHSPRHYAALGRLVAGAGAQRPAAGGRAAGRATWGRCWRACAWSRRPAKHANVLQHAAGYFKRLLTPGEKAELGETIDSYRRGLCR